MPVASSADFVEALSRCPLLTAQQQAELIGQLQARFPDARSLARQLLDRGWLTPYQANQVLMGRAADLVLGPYVVLERLGEGGAGQIVKARHQRLNRLAALKMVRKDLVADAETVQRFQREVQVVSQLNHPNVVRAFDAGPMGFAYVLAMEYVEGIDLHRLVNQKGPLPVAQACAYVRQAALGLQHIHERGLIHRDIKPSNLLVSGGVVSGEKESTTHHSPLTTHQVVKILDLGLARLQQPTSSPVTGTVTATETVIGSVDYMSPEQALDFRRVDIRGDIYSLGCTFFFLLTGQPPYPDGTSAQKLLCHQMKEPPPIDQFRRDVPPGILAVLQRMIEKQRENRYQTPVEVVRALDAPLAIAVTPRQVPVSASQVTVNLLPVAAPYPVAIQVERVLMEGDHTVPVSPPDRQWTLWLGRAGNLLRLRSSAPAGAPPSHRRRCLVAAGVVLLALIGWLVVSSSRSGPAQVVYLSDLEEAAREGIFGKNGLTQAGSRYSVKGKLSPNGLSIFFRNFSNQQVGKGRVVYRLNREYKVFRCTVGVADGFNEKISATFTIMGDGKELWQSKSLAEGMEPVETSVPVKNLDQLELVAIGTGVGDCNAVWFEPRLEK
ncbi:hypothetical protein AYO44_00925 [Planctomycetaceae bacterium SCGC AG-212-F19]|nr:hypothetical protein AYO44_00925 [Planctomycetaceae bacterium SCGC AG-212-F19]